MLRTALGTSDAWIPQICYSSSSPPPPLISLCTVRSFMRGLCWLVAVVLLVARCTGAEPRYFPDFDEKWSYQLKTVDKVLAQGPIRFAAMSNGTRNATALYYFMPCLDNWEQIVLERCLFNFWRANASCTILLYPQPLLESYFSLSVELTAGLFSGMLRTASFFGRNETFVVGTDAAGFVNQYFALNAGFSGGLPFSEVLTQTQVNRTAPNAALFDPPSFCKDEPAYSSCFVDSRFQPA